MYCPGNLIGILVPDISGPQEHVSGVSHNQVGTRLGKLTWARTPLLLFHDAPKRDLRGGRAT